MRASHRACHQRPHDLPHCNATLLLKAGVRLKVVQERRGHASSKVTMDNYSHVTRSMSKDAAAILEVSLRQRDASRRPTSGPNRRKAARTMPRGHTSAYEMDSPAHLATGGQGLIGRVRVDVPPSRGSSNHGPACGCASIARRTNGMVFVGGAFRAVVPANSCKLQAARQRGQRPPRFVMASDRSEGGGRGHTDRAPAWQRRRTPS
jgi:hypothetical protein